MNAFLRHDSIEWHVPCLHGDRPDLLKGMRDADQQRTGGAGSGDGTVLKAAPLAETLAGLVERNKGDEHHVVLGKLHGLTVAWLVDAEAPSDRLGR